MKIFISLLLSLGLVGVSICTAAADPAESADKQGTAASQDAKKADANPQEAKKADPQPAHTHGNASSDSESGSGGSAAQPAKGDSSAGASGAVAEESSTAAKP